MSIAAARLSKKNVIALYSEIASVYDVWATLTETRARRRALRLARIANG